MRVTFKILIITFIVLITGGCSKNNKSTGMNIIFLHHSTGEVIWKGNNSTAISKLAGRISGRLENVLKRQDELPKLFEHYNKESGKNYIIKELAFPKASPYGWNNYPFDYYNIWVKNAGNTPFMEEPTLEMLTRDYQVIIFKHCFPVSNIQPDLDSADINSEIMTLSNYKLQYAALRGKLHEFPDTKFILFTGAVQVKSALKEDEALRAKEFFNWVLNEWDLPDDNIYLWDLYNLQTEGGLYFRDEYAVSAGNSHPNDNFAEKVVKLLFNRIIDVIDNNGRTTALTGEKI